MKTIPTPDFIISDTHFGHNNIIKYCNRPANHDDIMLNNWYNTITRDSIILHLGDFWFPKQLPFALFQKLSKLPGRKYLIKGNHDKDPDAIRRAGFNVINTSVKIFHREKTLVFSHRPEVRLRPDEINVHGHIHNNETAKFPFINVSVEVTNYAPMSMDDLYEHYILPHDRTRKV